MIISLSLSSIVIERYNMTNWKKASFIHYSLHQIYLAESGDDYNYYLYIHSKGQIIIMRENISGTEYLYADGGFSPQKSWDEKENLDYTFYNLI